MIVVSSYIMRKDIIKRFEKAGSLKKNIRDDTTS